MRREDLPIQKWRTIAVSKPHRLQSRTQRKIAGEHRSGLWYIKILKHFLRSTINIQTNFYNRIIEANYFVQTSFKSYIYRGVLLQLHISNVKFV